MQLVECCQATMLSVYSVFKTLHCSSLTAVFDLFFRVFLQYCTLKSSIKNLSKVICTTSGQSGTFFNERKMLVHNASILFSSKNTLYTRIAHFIFPAVAFMWQIKQFTLSISITIEVTKNVLSRVRLCYE